MTKTSKRDLHIDLWEEFKAVGLQRNFDPRPFGYYSWKEPNVLKKHKEVWRTEPENDIDLRKYQGGTLRLSGPYELFRQSGGTEFVSSFLFWRVVLTQYLKLMA
jgi:hypothetical protein